MAIDGAGIHTGATTHALQRLPVVFVGKDVASPIVYQHHVHLGARTGLTEMEV